MLAGVRLKNASRRPSWISSDDNDRSSFRVEARSAGASRPELQDGGFGATGDDQSGGEGRKARAKKTGDRQRSLCNGGSHYYETRMDDIRAHREATRSTWRRAGELRRAPAACAIARVAVTPRRPLRSSRVRNFVPREESRGTRRAREERMDVSSPRLFANFGNIRSSSPTVLLLLPRPAYDGDEPPVASLTA